MSKSRTKKDAKPAPKTTGRGSTDEPHSSGEVEIVIDGVRVPVSRALDVLVQRAINAAQRLPDEMTTTQAADFLDVSRPFVIKLIDRGELPCRMVGKHRRIPTSALRDYREKMFQRSRKAVGEMTRIGQELGLYELEGPPPDNR